MRRTSPPEYVRARLERTAALVRESKIAKAIAARRTEAERAAQRARFAQAAVAVDTSHSPDDMREAQAVIDAAPMTRQGMLRWRRSA